MDPKTSSTALGKQCYHSLELCENNICLSSHIWLFVRINGYKMLHRHLVVLLLLDDIQVTFQKRKPAHFVKCQFQKAVNVPSVSENSERVDLAVNCIGLPVLSWERRDEQRAWGTPIKAKGEVWKPVQERAN